jgi:MoxR-like ATPase
LLLLGKPGTAKSEIGRRLGILVKGRFFERLVTRFSVPEELFGPLSLRGLEQDEYRRQTDGYLPTATVAFVDEIFKANSAVLNSLLTLLNERTFDNGSQRVRVPLLCLIGASNELPEDEQLDALYDRFLLRRNVQQVSADGLLQLLSASSRSMQHFAHADAIMLQRLFDVGTLAQIRRDAHANTNVPDAVHHVLRDVRTWLHRSGMNNVSDRRMTRAVRMLQVAAYTSGRRQVTLQDCLLLEHVLWSHPDHASVVRAWLVDRITPAADGAAVDGAAGDGQLDTIFAELCRTAYNNAFLQADGNVAHEQLARLCDTIRTQARLAAQREQAAKGGGLHSVWLSVTDVGEVSEQASHAARADRMSALELLRDALRMSSAAEEKAPPQVLARMLPGRWTTLAKNARERALSTERRLRSAIPPCGHRIARAHCRDCMQSMFGVVEGA